MLLQIVQDPIMKVLIAVTLAWVFCYIPIWRLLKKSHKTDAWTDVVLRRMADKIHKEKMS
jgi:hypothetical protein